MRRWIWALVFLGFGAAGMVFLFSRTGKESGPAVEWKATPPVLRDTLEPWQGSSLALLSDSLSRRRFREWERQRLAATGEYTRLRSLLEEEAGDPHPGDPALLRLVKGWEAGAPERVTWGRPSFRLPLKRNVAGHILVPVRINGMEEWFILDTGLDQSMISSALAGEAGVPRPEEGLVPAPAGVRTTAPVGAVIIDQLEVGDLRIEKHRAYFVRQEDVEFRIWFATVFRLRGILGWNAIRNMKLEIQLEDEFLEVERSLAAWEAENDPGGRDQAAASLIWTGRRGPAMRAVAANGTPLLLLLDTGSSTSSLRERVPDRLGLELSGTVPSFRGDGEGLRRERDGLLTDFSFFLGHVRYSFPRISVRPAEDPDLWPPLDGAAGLDLFEKARLSLDPGPGTVEVRRPEP